MSAERVVDFSERAGVAQMDEVHGQFQRMKNGPQY
jgi:hypothetical protein